MTYKLQHLIHHHPGCLFDFDKVKNFKKVVCTQPIHKGEIISIEHALFTFKDDTVPYIQDCIRWNKSLFEGLYPREQKWQPDFYQGKYSKEIENVCEEKLTKNRFVNEEFFILGLETSSFNASNDYNAGALIFSRPSTTLNPHFITIAALRDIHVNEEICIYYFYDNNEINLDTYYKKVEIYVNKLDEIKDQVSIQTHQHIDEYFKTRVAKLILFNQITCYQGIYNEQTLPRFYQYMRDKYGGSEPSHIKQHRLDTENLIDKFLC